MFFGKIPKPKKHVFVCMQQRPPVHPRGSCSAKGSAAVFEAFAVQLEKQGLVDEYALNATGCIGPCTHGPTVLVYPEGVMYAKVQPSDVPTIIAQHLKGGEPVKELLVPDDVWG